MTAVSVRIPKTLCQPSFRLSRSFYFFFFFLCLLSFEKWEVFVPSMNILHPLLSNVHISQKGTCFTKRNAKSSRNIVEIVYPLHSIFWLRSHFNSGRVVSVSIILLLRLTQIFTDKGLSCPKPTPWYGGLILRSDNLKILDVSSFFHGLLTIWLLFSCPEVVFDMIDFEDQLYMCMDRNSVVVQSESLFRSMRCLSLTRIEVRSVK